MSLERMRVADMEGHFTASRDDGKALRRVAARYRRMRANLRESGDSGRSWISMHPRWLIPGRTPAAHTVRDYYEHNTRRFLRFGAQATIHRGLWGPGVLNVQQAAHWIHGEILALLEERHREEPVRWLDLGCGVGTSCCWLASRRPGTGVGLTISEVQVALATGLAQQQDLAERCRFLLADFCAMPDDLGLFSLAYAIEAYVHAPDPAALFASVARHLADGGVFVLIDDVLAPGVDPAHPIVARFREGWHAHALSTVEDIDTLARRAGLALAQDRDLTPLVRLGRPRDHLIRWLQPVLRAGAPYSPWFQSLVGGDALQQGLRTGLIEHRWLLFTASP